MYIVIFHNFRLSNFLFVIITRVIITSLTLQFTLENRISVIPPIISVFAPRFEPLEGVLLMGTLWYLLLASAFPTNHLLGFIA